MSDPRLEQILADLARRYAPELLPGGWQRPGDYPGRLADLATRLAGYNVLVMMGDPPPEHQEQTAEHVKQWVEDYVQLYDLLARALFPSFTLVSAYNADSEQPPVVFLHGNATPVIMVLARYVAPYVASRQRAARVSDFEIVGLMNIILDELEAGDLSYDHQRQLRDEGVGLVRQMLDAAVRQRRLTEPKRVLQSAFDLKDEGAGAMPTPVGERTVSLPLPPSIPEATGSPPLVQPPDVLPEQDVLPQPPPNLPALPGSRPIAFESKSRGRRRPPVPDLPDGLE